MMSVICKSSSLSNSMGSCTSHPCVGPTVVWRHITHTPAPTHHTKASKRSLCGQRCGQLIFVYERGRRSGLHSIAFIRVYLLKANSDVLDK